MIFSRRCGWLAGLRPLARATLPTALALLALMALPVQPASAQLRALDDNALREHAGRGGVYLSGELSLNKLGGPLWQTPASTDAAGWAANERSCAPAGSTTPLACGARVAVQAEATGGWYVLDSLRGTFSFVGLTLRTRRVDSGFDGDGALFGQQVLEIGLPSEVSVRDGAFSFAIANQAGWRNNQSPAAAGGDASFQQTNLLSMRLDGSLRLQGNALLFPRP